MRSAEPRLMVLNRDAEIREPKTGVLIFKKDEPVLVSRFAQGSARRIGAEYVESSDQYANLEEELSPEEDAEVRAGAIRNVVSRILDRNDADDFTAGGMPKVNVVNSELDFRATSEEIHEAWRELSDDGS